MLDTQAEADVAIFDDRTGRENMLQLIQLRWIAVVGQIVTIAVVHFVFGIHLPLHDMTVVVLVLAAFNAASLLRWRAPGEVTNSMLFVSLLVDVATFTAQLYTFCHHLYILFSKTLSNTIFACLKTIVTGIYAGLIFLILKYFRGHHTCDYIL